MKWKDVPLYLAFRIAVLSFAYLPFWVIYRLSDFSAWLMHHVLRIRRDTVVENLRRSFPDKSSKELNKLVKKTYQNFCDVMIFETLKSFSMSSKQINKRFRLLNPELGQRYEQEQRSLIAVVGHYANWEWGTSKHQQGGYECIDFYKPLKNKYIDHYVRVNRARHGSQLRSVLKAPSTFLGTRDRVCCYTLIADKQNIKRKRFKSVMWLPFLGQDSPFLIGPEKYAKSFNCTVIYGKIDRVKRGYYTLEVVPVCEDPQSAKDGFITQSWVSHLEKQVKHDPASWLWFFAATRARQDHQISG